MAKFVIHGITPEQMKKLTLKQIHYALMEWGEDARFQLKLAHFEVEETDKIATLQDLMGFGM